MLSSTNSSSGIVPFLAGFMLVLGFIVQSCATEAVAPMQSLPKVDAASNLIQVATFDAGPNGKWRIYGAPDNQNHPTTLKGRVLASDPPEHHEGPGGSYTINLNCYGEVGTCATFTSVGDQRRYLDINTPSNESGG